MRGDYPLILMGFCGRSGRRPKGALRRRTGPARRVSRFKPTRFGANGWMSARGVDGPITTWRCHDSASQALRWSLSERSDRFAAQALSKFWAPRRQYNDIHVARERCSQSLFQALDVHDKLEPRGSRFGRQVQRQIDVGGRGIVATSH